MPNELPLPNDLQHLIEKREGNDRRRSAESPGTDRRRGDDRRGFEEDSLPGDTVSGPAKFACGLCGKSITIPAGEHPLPRCACTTADDTGWYSRES